MCWLPMGPLPVWIGMWPFPSCENSRDISDGFVNVEIESLRATIVTSLSKQF